MMEKYFSLLYDAAGRHKRLIAAVWVSALTTIVGAFSLLFARHPALFSIGLTLTIGLMGRLSGGTVCSACFIQDVDGKEGIKELNPHSGNPDL
jgi:preprotein translocase subunit SecF